MSQNNHTGTSQSTFSSQTAIKRRELLQAYALATLFLGVIVAWGWACIVGINS